METYLTDPTNQDHKYDYLHTEKWEEDFKDFALDKHKNISEDLFESSRSFRSWIFIYI